MLNTTNPVLPSFYLTGLKPDTGYMISIVASNSKGYSDRRVLQAFTIKSDGLTQLIETNESALATNMDDLLPITPLVTIALVITGVIISVFLPITIIVCVRRRKRSATSQATRQSGTSSSNVHNNSGLASNGHVICSSTAADLRMQNSRDDIFSEFEDTGSSISGSGVENDKRKRIPDPTAEPDIIPPYTPSKQNNLFIPGK